MTRKAKSIRGARTALFCALLSFVFMQWTLLVLIQSWKPRPAHDPEYAHKLSQLRARLSQTKTSGPLILVLGSSRIATGFRPEILPRMQKSGPQTARIFNLGICQWVEPATQSIILHRVLRERIRPDCVLFEIFPAIVSAGPEQLITLNLTRVDWQDLEVVRPYTASWLRQRVNWMGTRWVPAFSQRFLLLSRYAPKWVELNKAVNFNWARLGDWGWTCLPNYNLRYPITNERKAAYKVRLGHAFMSETSRQIYQDMFEFCRKSNIAVGLVLMPEHSQFRELYTPASEARLQEAFNDLGARFDVPVVDARTWMPDEAFVEGVHLTHAGAAAFTQLFDAKIIQPTLLTDVRFGAR